MIAFLALFRELGRFQNPSATILSGTFKNEVRLSVKNLIKNRSKINGDSIDKKLQAYQGNKSSQNLCYDLRRTKHREDIPGDRGS